MATTDTTKALPAAACARIGARGGTRCHVPAIAQVTYPDERTESVCHTHLCELRRREPDRIVGTRPHRITVAVLREIAHRSTERGWYRTGHLRGYVFCPLCRYEVHADGFAPGRPRSLGDASVVRALRAAVLAHLNDDCLSLGKDT